MRKIHGSSTKLSSFQRAEPSDEDINLLESEEMNDFNDGFMGSIALSLRDFGNQTQNIAAWDLEYFGQWSLLNASQPVISIGSYNGLFGVLDSEICE